MFPTAVPVTQLTAAAESSGHGTSAACPVIELGVPIGHCCCDEVVNACQRMSRGEEKSDVGL
ncbi:hypothetical protein EYF80_005537 [Liparis tanakae]|uniref:Uncharacterized protein n=1 Tax=Liparis tanakae TaxID=230148 RepID=A0A4Z2J1W2_9TELE|nr:hypothetical protein EYF80_005537 [Liparis tanakae]